MGDSSSKSGTNNDDILENPKGMREQIMNASFVVGEPFGETQPPELLERPWRQYQDIDGKNWTEKNADKLKSDISKCEEKINLLFVGQVQSGKSSTINSLISIQEDAISERAKAGKADDSLTVHFNVIQGEGFLKNIKFCDLLGLEMAEGKGLQLQEILYASLGRLTPGTHLCHGQPHDPCEADESRRIHCLVYVVDGENVVINVTDAFSRKISNIEKALNIGPNRVVFVTKINKICPKIKEDIRNIFYSRKVFEAVQNASKLVGVSINKVFPVHNYTEEVEVDTFTNVPLLLALKAAIKMGADYIKGQKLDSIYK